MPSSSPRKGVELRPPAMLRPRPWGPLRTVRYIGSALKSLNAGFWTPPPSNIRKKRIMR